MQYGQKCKDCLHCTVDGDEVLCVDMPWHYPFGGSDSTTLDKEACEHFLEREQPTLFGLITKSPETLAQELVTLDCDGWWAYIGIGKRKTYRTREEAIAATVAKLKEVCVKQNEKCDTQTNLWKNNHTQNEVEE